MQLHKFIVILQLFFNITLFSQENSITEMQRSNDLGALFNLYVTEMYEPCLPISVDAGPIFKYCGDIEGGIINLLQKTHIRTYPNIFFLNHPLKKRYVLFYGMGSHMKGKAMYENNNCNDSTFLYINGHEIVLKILKNQFNFTITERQDSLECFELLEKDSIKLLASQIPLSVKLKGQTTDDPINKPIHNVQGHLWYIAWLIEKKWNKFVDSNVERGYIPFYIDIPAELFDSSDRHEQLNLYLETQYGLTISKKKKLKTVYYVKFNQ